MVSVYMGNAKIGILIIEDSPVQARLIEEMLSEVPGARFHLEWADRLSKGLECLAGGGIDLVLLDLTLPDSWGLDTFIRVRTAHPAIPVVVLTGAGDEKVFREAGQRGAQECMVKDQLSSASLGRCIRNALAGKRRDTDTSG
jgi:DNA-binding NarL/FixJ family response regulator